MKLPPSISFATPSTRLQQTTAHRASTPWRLSFAAASPPLTLFLISRLTSSRLDRLDSQPRLSSSDEQQLLRGQWLLFNILQQRHSRSVRIYLVGLTRCRFKLCLGSARSRSWTGNSTDRQLLLFHFQPLARPTRRRRAGLRPLDRCSSQRRGAVLCPPRF